MKKWLVVAAALVAVGLPTAYAATTPATGAHAQSGDSGAAKACKTERTSMGVEAFDKKYGTNPNLRNAFGKCVSGKTKKNG
jgi:hypothetical protein